VGVGGLAVLVRPDRLKVWGWIRVSGLGIRLSGCGHKFRSPLMKLMESTEDEQNEKAITTDSKGSDQVREKR